MWADWPSIGHTWPGQPQPKEMQEVLYPLFRALCAVVYTSGQKRAKPSPCVHTIAIDARISTITSDRPLDANELQTANTSLKRKYVAAAPPDYARESDYGYWVSFVKQLIRDLENCIDQDLSLD